MQATTHHARWCAVTDDVSRRVHMALTEAGVECDLVEERNFSCGLVHVNVCTHSHRDRAALDHAALLAMPPEMFAEWAEIKAELRAVQA